MIWSPERVEFTQTRRGLRSSAKGEGREPLALSRSVRVKDRGFGESTKLSSIFSSSFSATVSLRRMRQNAARKDIIAIYRKFERRRKVRLAKGDPTCMTMDDQSTQNANVR
jgi:hypothetical protein